MVNKVVYVNTLEEALDVARSVADKLAIRGRHVTRLKIEIPAHCADQWKVKASQFACYFEWHGKVKSEPTPALLEHCERHVAHLSINALKKEQPCRVITMREYGSREVFNRRIAALGTALGLAGR